MSERYGTRDEIPELLADVEEWANGEIEEARQKIMNEYASPVIKYYAGRKDALTELLDRILVNPGG